MRKRPFALWGLTQGHVIAASLMTESRQTIAVTLHRAMRVSRLSRPGGRALFHVRHFAATAAFAFAEPSGCNNDGDTKYEARGRKGVQNRDSSRAFLTLCHVIRHCRQLQNNKARWLRVPTTDRIVRAVQR